MDKKWLEVFEKNYEIYIKRQWDLIDACFEALDLNNNELDVENATRHLEQMFWRAKKKSVYGTASHHFHIYSFGEFFNLHQIPTDEFEDRYSWKYTVSKNNYEKYKEIFDERDKKVLDKLKEIGSNYWISYEELQDKKEYFPNMIKLYWESMKEE